MPVPRRARNATAALAVLVSLACVVTACGAGNPSRPASSVARPDAARPATVRPATVRVDPAGVAHLAVLTAASTRLAGSGADRTAPTLRNLTWTPTFYPVRDGYRDSFTVAATASERTWVMLVVRNARNHLVRREYAVHDAGRMSVSWNGYLGSGRLAAAGGYHWYLVWHDAAGNESYSAHRSLTVSHRHLVTRIARYSRNGNAYWQAGGSDPSCSQADERGSFYPHGVWLANDCSAAIAAAFYTITAPEAISYTGIGLMVWGFTDHAGTRIYRAYGRSGGTGSFAGGFVTLHDTQHANRSFGTVPAAGLVSSTRRIVLALSVDNRPAGKRDLDIYRLRIAVTYRVLN